MCKRFLFLLSIVIGMVLEGNGSARLHLTGFLGDEHVDLALKKGKYLYVSDFLRKNRAAYEEEREGPVQARALLYLVGDNGSLFLEDPYKERLLNRAFLSWLPEAEQKGFPIDLLQAFWHFEKPVGPFATGPVFPNHYDSFFSHGNRVTRDPEEGALILLRKALRRDRHARYWLGHWWLFDQRSLERLVPRLSSEEKSFSLAFIAQCAGRGAVSLTALERHKQAAVEEESFHRRVSNQNQSDWKEGCGGWGCCPGNRLCPARTGDGCDLRRFDPRACCGVGGFRDDEWACNCCLCGCYTKWSSKEAWVHTEECGNKALFLARQGSQYCGTCLNTVGAATSITGLAVPDPTTIIAGVVITGIGTGCQICSATFPHTANERREGRKLQKLRGYLEEVRDEVIGREPISDFTPSAGASAFPTALPSHNPSIMGGTPAMERPMERGGHHSAPPVREKGGNWFSKSIKRSLKGLQQGLRDLSIIQPEPPSLISAAEAAALMSNAESNVIATQPRRDYGVSIVEESGLGETPAD
jgi:hypothetical protein